MTEFVIKGCLDMLPEAQYKLTVFHKQMYREKMRAVVLTAIITLFVLSPAMPVASASDTSYQQKQVSSKDFGKFINDYAWSLLYNSYPYVRELNSDIIDPHSVTNNGLDIYRSKTGEEQPAARVI